MLSSVCDLIVRAGCLMGDAAQIVGDEGPATVEPSNASVRELAGLLVLALLFAGVAVWGMVIARWRRGKPAMAPVPRRGVPWRAIEVCVIFGFLLCGALFAGHGSRPSAERASSRHSAERDSEGKPRESELSSESDDEPASAAALTPRDLAANAIVSVALVGGILAFLVFVRGANAVDLGFSPWCAADVVRGTLTWAAVLVPVYALQNLLVHMIDQTARQEHPLLESVGKDRSGMLLLLAGVTAVVVAPLAEEFLFRVMLQGWLEKLFAPRAAGEANDDASEFGLRDVAGDTYDAGDRGEREMHSSPALPRAIAEANAATQSTAERESHTGSVPPTVDYYAAYVSPETPLNARPTAVSPPSIPPQFPNWRAIAPIVISSAMFAAAHAGVWPDPVPLFLLALALGYVYHQTHRIWPSVLVHMLFNGFSIALVAMGAA